MIDAITDEIVDPDDLRLIKVNVLDFLYKKPKPFVSEWLFYFVIFDYSKIYATQKEK